MLKRRLCFIFLLIISAIPAYGIDLGATVFATTADMSAVGDMIDLYNDMNDSDIQSITAAIGAELHGSIPFSSWLSARATASLQGARTGTDREKLTTTLMGFLVGPQVSLGAWSANVGIGVNRATFSFPASFYESLRGWSFGMSSSIGYTLRISRTLCVEAAARFQLAPIRSLRDLEDGVYVARDGAFLSFTGIGFSIGITWKR